MMSDKMSRFLRSLGISDIDSFDMEFDLVKRNEIVHDQVDMMITKTYPWNEAQISQFMDGLRGINYQYQITFAYRNEPSVYDAINLFSGWYRMNYYVLPNFEVEPSKNDSRTINFIVKEEDFEHAKSVRKDYKEFLAFLFYRFEIEVNIKQEEVKEVVSEEEINKLTETANTAA